MNFRQAIKATKDVYNGSLDNVDIWAGGMLETTPDGPGELFQKIIRNQFRRIRSADRFWFENYKQNRCDVVTYLLLNPLIVVCCYLVRLPACLCAAYVFC